MGIDCNYSYSIIRTRMGVLFAYTLIFISSETRQRILLTAGKVPAF